MSKSFRQRLERESTPPPVVTTPADVATPPLRLFKVAGAGGLILEATFTDEAEAKRAYANMHGLDHPGDGSPPVTATEVRDP